MSTCLRCLTDAQPTEVPPKIKVRKPAAGTAVLACACGRVLDADEMRRKPSRIGDSRYLRPIVCVSCAS